MYIYYNIIYFNCSILLFCAVAHDISKGQSFKLANSQFQPEMTHLKKVKAIIQMTVRRSIPGRLKRGQLSLGLVIQVLRWNCLFLWRGLSKENEKLSTTIHCIHTGGVDHLNTNNLINICTFLFTFDPLEQLEPRNISSAPSLGWDS